MSKRNAASSTQFGHTVPCIVTDNFFALYFSFAIQIGKRKFAKDFSTANKGVERQYRIVANKLLLKEVVARYLKEYFFFVKGLPAMPDHSMVLNR